MEPARVRACVRVCVCVCLLLLCASRSCARRPLFSFTREQVASNAHRSVRCLENGDLHHLKITALGPIPLRQS